MAVGPWRCWLQLGQGGQLVLGQQAAARVLGADAGLQRNRLHGGRVVAAQHHGLHAQGAQLGDGLGHMARSGSATANQGMHGAAACQQGDAATLAFVLSSVASRAASARPARASGAGCRAASAGCRCRLHAAAGQGL